MLLVFSHNAEMRGSKWRLPARADARSALQAPRGLAWLAVLVVAVALPLSAAFSASREPLVVGSGSGSSGRSIEAGDLLSSGSSAFNVSTSSSSTTLLPSVGSLKGEDAGNLKPSDSASSVDRSGEDKVKIVPDALIMEDGVGSSGSLALPEVMHGVPSNPTLVTAAAFDGTAEVTWKAPDDDGGDLVEEYEVAWFDEEQNAPAGTQTVPAARLGADEILIAHLVNGRSYTFKVRAKNKNGYSVWSAKSPAVSPLHPPDLCGRLSCSGRGACFPNYHPAKSTWLDVGDRRELQVIRASLSPASETAIDDDDLVNAFCICRPEYSPPDCSVKSDPKTARYVWKMSEWSDCTSGCGGGKRTRVATCFDTEGDEAALDEHLCADKKKPTTAAICNSMECGSRRVVIKYQIEIGYDEVLFSPEALEAFELAFTTEVASALQVPRTRLEVTAIRRGSIIVYFQILPASRAGEKSLNDIVGDLQDQLANSTSVLRTMGTFARRIEPTGVKLSFSIADDTVAGGAEDISIMGLIGTVMVLCFFVTAFGWFLRRRHHRLMAEMKHQLQHQRLESPNEDMVDPATVGMKRMGIKTMA